MRKPHEHHSRGTRYDGSCRSYFATPVAYVFIVIFLVLMGTFTFNLGGFYERGQADLAAIFQFPLRGFTCFSFLQFRCAYGRKSARPAAIELLLTLPVTPWQAVIGKYLSPPGYSRA